MFEKYPDVVDVKQMCEMLGGISVKTGYKLIHSGVIKAFRIGRAYYIPKIYLIQIFTILSNMEI